MAEQARLDLWEDVPFPLRQTAPARRVAWVSVSYRAILEILHHFGYAGAYVFGRTETRRKLDPEDPRGVWSDACTVETASSGRVLILDHHPGYISFEKHFESRERIRDNEVMGARSDEGQKEPPARAGACRGLCAAGSAGDACSSATEGRPRARACS